MRSHPSQEAIEAIRTAPDLSQRLLMRSHPSQEAIEAIRTAPDLSQRLLMRSHPSAALRDLAHERSTPPRATHEGGVPWKRPPPCAIWPEPSALGHGADSVSPARRRHSGTAQTASLQHGADTGARRRRLPAARPRCAALPASESATHEGGAPWKRPPPCLPANLPARTQRAPAIR